MRPNNINFIVNVTTFSQAKAVIRIFQEWCNTVIVPQNFEADLVNNMHDLGIRLALPTPWDSGSTRERRLRYGSWSEYCRCPEDYSRFKTVTFDKFVEIYKKKGGRKAITWHTNF